MPIKFEPDLFESDEKERITVDLSDVTVKCLDALQTALKHKDRSKTIRWCIEHVLREAIENDVIPPPGNKV